MSQNRAAKVVFRQEYDIRTEHILYNLKWLKLGDRRFKQQIEALMMYKIQSILIIYWVKKRLFTVIISLMLSFHVKQFYKVTDRNLKGTQSIGQSISLAKFILNLYIFHLTTLSLPFKRNAEWTN